MSDENQEYQGWKNAQTWCVALTFDNSKKLQDQVLRKVKIYKTLDMIEIQLWRMALDNQKEIIEMAPWAFENLKKPYPHGINFRQLANHFLDKFWEQKNAISQAKI